MIRLHGKKRLQVPHTLAIFAAALLAACALAKLGDSAVIDFNDTARAGSEAATENLAAGSSADSRRTLNLSLLLFRRG